MNNKSVAALWLMVGCAAALAKAPSPPPAPAPAPVENVIQSVYDAGIVSPATDYLSGTVLRSIPNGQPAGSYDVFTDIYSFSVLGSEDVTGTARIVGASNQKTFALTNGLGELSLYDGVYQAGSNLSGYTLQEQVMFGHEAASLVEPLPTGRYFFVVQGTTSGSQGGKYSFELTAAAQASAVPEPANAALLLAAVGLLAGLARRRRAA